MLNLNELEDVELFIKIKFGLFPDIQKSIVKPDPVSAPCVKRSEDLQENCLTKYVSHARMTFPNSNHA
jgi:hypothetical protein